MGATNIRTKLFYGNIWQHTPSYERVSVSSSWGLSDEGTAIGQSSCTAQLDNRSGDYNPDDARSSLFGKIGRNTPGRIALLPGLDSGELSDTADAFGRTVASGWGSADVGGAWSLAGLGGTVQTSDWAVGSGVGTVGVPDVATAYRESYLTSIDVRDVDVAVTFKVAQATGGPLEPGILLRGGSSGYFRVRVQLTATNTVDIAVLARGDEVIGGTTVAGLTHTGTGQPLRVRALAAGNRFHVKVWIAANAEPDEWQLTVFDTNVDSSEAPIAGFIGVYSGRGVGNTNAGTVTFTYDDWESTTYVPIADGAVAVWQPDRDSGYDPDTHEGGDSWTDIEISGPAERVNSSKAALSAIRRTLLATRPDAYWPLEDPEGTTAPLSGLQGGSPGRIVSGTPAFGVNPDNLVSGSASLVDAYTSTALIEFPLEGFADGAVQVEIVAGALSGVASDIVLEIVTSSNDHWFATTVSGDAGNGRMHHYVVHVVENGANTDYQIYLDGVIDSAFSLPGDVGVPLAIRIGGSITSGGSGATWYLGHVMAFGISADFPDAFHDPSGRAGVATGYIGEAPEDRFMRLCQEHGIAGGVNGDPSLGSIGMGMQPVETLSNLFTECATTDLGFISDGRAWSGLELRPGRSMNNQTPALELTYGVNVHPPVKPVTDNLGIANDYTANDRSGATARAEQLDGPNNVNDPIDDPEGIGRTEGSVDVNAEEAGTLVDIAGVSLLRSTWPGSRYRNVTIDLTKHPELLVAAMALRVGDLITLDALDADLIELIVLGGAHTVESYHHVLTLNCAPGGPYRVVQDDADNGEDPRADLAGSRIAADFDAGTDTSMSVEVDGPVLWDTTAPPFHVRVGGVVLNVTAISGASSPQTFTVDAPAVNGITRTIAADDPEALTRVQLEHPWFIEA